jgi:N-acetylmuramoyl-L-alanine amidase
MKISVRGGHNFQAKGAVGIIDETTEDRKVKDTVIKYLQALGHSVLDVTPGDCDVNTDLAYGVNKATEWGAELFISIHFNNAYSSYAGAIGTETWIYATGGNAEPIARRIVNKVATETGLINRGVKTSTGLYELRKTKCPAIIVEVCFVEATTDVGIYQSKGFDFIGKCIAEAISDQSVQSTQSVQETTQTTNQSTAQSGQYGVVTADVLNVRDGRSTSANIIGQLTKGTKVKVDQKMGDWYSVYFGDHGGFVYAQYLQV